jgi:hypothetical protein
MGASTQPSREGKELKASAHIKLLDVILDTVIKSYPPASIGLALIGVRAIAQGWEANALASPDVTDDEVAEVLAEISRVEQLLLKQQDASW